MCIAEFSVARVRFHVLFLLTAGLTSAACGGSATTSVSAPSPTAARCQPALDSSPRSFGPQGGTSAISVTVARECQWSVSSGAAWVTVTSGAQGQGDGTVNVRIDPNPDPVARSGVVLIADARVEVAQQGEACRFEVTRPDPVLARDRSSCATPSPHARALRLVGRFGSAVGQPGSWLGPGHRDNQPYG